MGRLIVEASLMIKERKPLSIGDISTSDKNVDT